MTRGLRPDAWAGLRDRTPARIALGRAGASLPTAELLAFALDHAEARDAVHATLEAERLTADLGSFGRITLAVASAAVDHADYLRHPDHGRRLDDASRRRLAETAGDAPDVVLVLADGLSATAANRHGVALVAELLARLDRFAVGPLVLASRARVALQDDIGHALRARCCVIHLGERPGLGAADSLGAYLVFDPKPGRTDAERNCVSNVRPAGLPLAAAADTIAYLVDAALSRRISGVTLKDDRVRSFAPSPGTAGEGWGGGLPGVEQLAGRRPPPYPSPGVPGEGTRMLRLDPHPHPRILESPMRKLPDSILAAKRDRGLALLPFIAAGYPDLTGSMKLLPALERGGASAVEIGFPFSDPIADGPVIQQAFTEALALGLKIDHIFAGLAAVRDQYTLPTVAMVSYSIVYRFGLDRFVKSAKEAGFDGLLLPDLPPPEAEYVCDKVRAGGLDTVLLISPSTTVKRREKIARLCSGFVYYLSLAGTTGERDKLPADLTDNVRQIKELTDTPVCVGFGISKPEHLKQLSAVADGAIVGTAFVRRIKGAPDAAVAVESYARELLTF